MNVLALDIGGTWLRAAVDRDTTQMRTPATGAAALAATFELADPLAGGIDAVGVSFGGRVKGDDVLSLHVPGWEDVGLADALRERYGVARVVVRRKAHYSKPATQALIEEMAGEVQVAIAAVGG